MRAQRIVHAIRKPRNNADGAIAPKPGWDGAFRAICCVAPLANGDLPLASRRFVHLIPASLRRDHAGLIQRFLSRYPDDETCCCIDARSLPALTLNSRTYADAHDRGLLQKLGTADLRELVLRRHAGAASPA